MNAFIIYYNLSQPGSNYEKLTSTIQTYEGWAQLGNFSYLVLTEKNHAEVRDTLAKVLYKDDSLFVGKISAPAAWFNLNSQVGNWILSNLK
ncbi:MAG: hypothetical protein LBH33_03985 [Endomicrobium sp.]|jgi:hypothetical protein|nr:hypothetical protein [Endomicrobium sp.]